MVLPLWRSPLAKVRRRGRASRQHGHHCMLDPSSYQGFQPVSSLPAHVSNRPARAPDTTSMTSGTLESTSKRAPRAQSGATRRLCLLLSRRPRLLASSLTSTQSSTTRPVLMRRRSSSQPWLTRTTVPSWSGTCTTSRAGPSEPTSSSLISDSPSPAVVRRTLP